MDKIDPAAESAAEQPPSGRGSFFFQLADRPVWSYRWFHWTLGTTLVLLACSFALPPVGRVLQLAEPILVPILVGLALAYIFNPLVSLLEKKCRLPRPATAGVIIALGALTLLGVLVFVVPTVATESSNLAKDLPAHLEKLAAYIDSHHNLKLHDAEEIKVWLNDLATRIKSGEISFSDYGSKAGMALGAGWSLVAGLLGFAAYLLIFGIVTTICFFFFSWHFSAILVWPKPFIPVESLNETLRVAKLCDRAISAFIRGRLIQAMVFGTVLTIGWFACGVPYALLLGLSGGLLMLLPYLSIVTLPLAVGMVWFAHLGGKSDGAIAPLEWYMLAAPVGVYLFAYCLDAFGVEPLVQGKATGLSPLAVLLAVLIGGSIAGILGIILAIPTAACILIVWREVLLPRLKVLAGSR